MKKMLLVYSGGMDSTALLKKLIGEKPSEELWLLSFNYGSKHNESEGRSADFFSKKHKLKHLRVGLDFMALLNSHLLSSGEIPEGHYKDANMKKTVVPFRNGVMLSVATAIAASSEIDTIYLANHFGDHAVYPDCRKKFIESFADAAFYGTYNNIEIMSPFCDSTKDEIISQNINYFDDDIQKTWSCYKGGEVQCGRCATCFERREAFYLAGVEDKTEYIDKTNIVDLIKEYCSELEVNDV